MILKQVISGGQTGVDRAGLDAALAAGIAIGGFCPKGRAAEDGSIPEHYPLVEIDKGYRQRTRKNVEASDATLIIYSGMPVSGTALTIEFCLKQKKPFKLIDRELVTPEQAATAIERFLEEHEVACLNVAGPREGRTPGIHAYTCQVLASLFRVSATDD